MIQTIESLKEKQSNLTQSNIDLIENPQQIDTTLSIDVLNNSVATTENPLTDVERLYETQMNAIKRGFGKYLSLGNMPNAEKSIFNSDNIDENYLKSIIDHLYKHLDATGKAGASYWLQHAVKRVNDFRCISCILSINIQYFIDFISTEV